MTLLGVRSSADAFARLLDAPDGAEAVPVVHRLQSARPALEAATAPRAEFRSALRTRLLAVAAVQADAPVTTPVRSPVLGSATSGSRSRQRRVGITAGVMASVVALVGVGIASSRSLPGDPFYGLKRSAEGVQLSLASGAVDRGAAHLHFAATRLREVKGLTYGRQVLSLGPIGSAHVMAASGAGSALTRRVESALGAMDTETHSGRGLLEGAYRSSHRQEPLRLLMTFSAEQDAGLSQVMSALPMDARLHAQRSLAFVRTVGTDAAALLALAPCTGACSPGAPGLGTPAPGGPGVPRGSGAPSGPGAGVPNGPGGPGARSPGPAPHAGPVVPGGPGRPTAPTGGASLPGPGDVPSPGGAVQQPPAPPPVATPMPVPVPVPTLSPLHSAPLGPVAPGPTLVTGLPTPHLHPVAP